tara:strand:+ start:29189 stop:30121 length:933 start_codon:yes stop_codon:yes gene_type:complete
MKILITGAAGYIGSMLTNIALNKGYEVTALDRYENTFPSLALSSSNTNFNPVKGDVRDEPLVKSLIAKSDIIIPLAALVGAPICKMDPLNASSINADAIKMIVKYSSRQQKIIYPTTNSGYGIGEQNSFCDESTPLKPISLYGLTKVEAEQAILDSGNGVTLRLATVFGMSPKMRLDLMVNDFVYRAVNDRSIVIFEGSFRRNFIHIKDVASAFLHSIENYQLMNGEPYNVGLSSANLTKIELCNKIKEHISDFTIIESEIGQDPDKRDYVVSNQKIEDTGYKTTFNLDDGIIELIKGYKTFKNSINSNV